MDSWAWPRCRGPRAFREALLRADNLPHQIVYALYGLTEEEIAIVEESIDR